MVSVGFFVRLEAKPGQEAAVEQFLREARAMVDDEPGTTAWFAVRTGPTSFAIFDVFEDEAGREAHFVGAVRDALEARGPELFATYPVVERTDVLAAKLP